MLQDSDKQPEFQFGNHTDIGQVRPQNEDYMGYFNTLNGHLFVVCDGMGGHVGGAVASQMAVQSIRDYAQQQYHPNPNDILNGGIRYANHRIYQEAQLRPELHGMGTTCVVVLVRGKFAYYAHVGDSRIYLWRNEILQRITKDHSFVQTLVEQGVITEEDAAHHPRKNEILKALGTHHEVEPDIVTEPLVTRSNDTILLCTDGLTDMLNDHKISEVMGSNLTVQHKAMKLVQMANDFGGKDNITVQLIEFPKENNVTDTTNLSNTNPFEKSKRFTQVSSANHPSKETEKNFTEKKNRVNNDNIPDNQKNKRFSIPALLVLFLIASGVAYLYFSPDSPLMQNLANKRDNIIRPDRTDSTRVSKKVKQKVFEVVAKEFPILKTVTEKYVQAKEILNEVKEFTNKREELLTDWDSIKAIPAKEIDDLDEISDRYNISEETLKQVNDITSEEELQELDTLYVPIEK